MNQGMIGLDIGTASIKAVLVKRGMNRSTSVICRGSRFPEQFNNETSAKDLGEFIRRFLTRHHLTGYPATASLPSSWTISRILTLPFSNPKKIAKVIAFELEPLIPFGVDDLIIDHQILSTSSQGTNVLVLGVQRERTEHMMDVFSHAGVHIRGVESQSLAMVNAYRWGHPESTTTPVLLMDLGQFSTTLCLIGPEGITGLQTLLLGHHQLSTAVHADHPPLPSDSQSSERRSSSTTPVTEETSSNLESLIQNMRLTIRGFETQLGEPITQGFLFGGCASSDGIPDFLQSVLGINSLQTCPIQFGRGRRPLPSVFLPAFGLAVKHALKSQGSTINFYPQMGGKDETHDSTKTLWKHVAIAASIVVILGIANFSMHYHLQESRYQDLKQQLRQQYRALFPNTQLVVSETQQIKTSLVQDRRLLDFFGGNRQTILALLAEVSQRVGQEKGTEIHSVILDNTTMQFQATTNSFEAVERIRKKVMDAPWFHEVKVIDAQVGANTKQVKFGLTVNLKIV